MEIRRAVRVARAYTQQLNAPAERVFPLLCPVREADWIEGWEPTLVVTDSGVAELDCTFVTGTGTAEAIWTVTRYDPSVGAIEFIKVVPGDTVARISIVVRPLSDVSSAADIRYQHTALSPAGEASVAAFTEEHFTGFMQQWERRLNHYLETGTMLQALSA
jgi:hypothetical protein